MRRTYQVNDQCELELLVTGMTADEQNRLNTLLEEFIQSQDDAESMGQEIRTGIRQGRITHNVIERFSKWCHTGGRYAPGQEPARRLSQHVFGIELPRLIDQEDRRLPDYKTQVITLLRQYIVLL